MKKIETLTITEAKNGLAKREFSSVELTQTCIARIAQTEKHIHAFVTVTQEEALKEAYNADKLIAQGDSRPLLGIPYALKDNFCTRGIRTTASAKILDTFIPPYDATVVAKLKQAGAVMLGKTNMDAWAHGSSTETSDYGASKNPWDTNKLPGGSSGGSAAAIAADQTIFAIGSETAGSIRQPAAWCGVTGLKPTYGRVSRYGAVAMGSSLDSPGPITKTVYDSALVLEVLAGVDRFDATTSSKAVEAYTQTLKGNMQGLTIGVSDDYFDGVDNRVTKRVEESLDVLKKLGARIKKVSLFPPKYAIAVYTILQRSEVSSNLARYDGIRYGKTRAHFGAEAKKRMMLGAYTLSAGYYDAYYRQAQKVRTAIIDDFARCFINVDVIIGPTSPSVALPLGASLDHPMFGEIADILVEPSSIAGLCGINVPCGFVDKLPVGMQIIGPQFAESLILRVASCFQNETDWHTKKPKL